MNQEFNPTAFETERNGIIDKYREQERPSEIHHYTNPEAAMKIIEGKSLRLFHASFCNDPTELNHGLKKMCDAAKQMNFDPIQSLIRKADYQLLYGKAQPFIFCLSLAKDSLTQWEMYSGRNGCCITFGPGLDKLCFKGQPSEGTIGSVIYSTHKQEKLAKELCEQLHRHLQFKDLPDFRLQALITFINAAVFLKNPVFEHEQEWRIVYMGGRANLDAICYLPGTRFLRPYVEGFHSSLPIKSITIGPSDEQERLKRSMEHFTKVKSVDGVEVLGSDIQLSESG